MLNTLESKLIAASILIVLVVLALAGAVFVVARRGDQRQQELDHVSANATAIQGEFLLRQLRGDSVASLSRFVDEAAAAYDVRALMIGLDGEVVADSANELEKSRISLDGSVVSRVAVAGDSAPYITIQPAEGTPGSGLVLVAPPQLGPARPAFNLIGLRQLQYSLVLAVSEGTLASAWLELLPELGLAAAIAIPVAILLGVLIARYITRPLEQLTDASLQMASGRFDVEVPAGREDELGRLAQAFATMAQRVGESQSQMRGLVANVSHDMKTPLTSILGFSQALRDEASDVAETRRISRIIYDEAERLNVRLNDLLYLAELESGQVVLHQDAITLDQMLQQTTARIELDVVRRGVSLSLEAVTDAVVLTDGQKLERVLENLLDNARKFTPPGGHIIVGGGVRNGAVSIEIANTAPQLTVDELPRLFERYYRRDPGHDGPRSRAGSGLGLPIAQDLAQLLGGELSASLRNGDLVMELAIPVGQVTLPKKADRHVQRNNQNDAQQNTSDDRKQDREAVSFDGDVAW